MRSRLFSFMPIVAASTKPCVIGLTGSIGMGKSTASSFFRRCGIRVHDADAVVHKIYSAGGAAVAPVTTAFPGVEADDGGIDRTKLSAGLREGRFNLKELEAIVHPLVTADRFAFLESATADGEWIVVLDVPLLLETMDASKRSELLDALVVVSAPADVQKERVLARPGMTEEKLQFVLTKQVPDAEKRKAADFVIDTVGYSHAYAQLAKCLEELSERHSARYDAWRGNLPLPAKPPSDPIAFIDSPFTTRAAYDEYLQGARSLPSSALPSPIKGVSFDLDDTLWPTMPPILQAAKALTKAIEEFMPKSYAAGAAERSNLMGMMRTIAAEQPLLAHDFTELRRTSLKQLADKHGDDVEGTEEVMTRFLRARSDVSSHFFPGALDTLAALRSDGLPVGGCTNGNCDLRLHEEVSTHFDFAVTAGDSGAAKPSPVPFWHASASIPDCRPCNLVHIGDDVVTDLAGALKAGCRAILITFPANVRSEEQLAQMPPADPSRWREVASFEEAVAVVREWRSQEA